MQDARLTHRNLLLVSAAVRVFLICYGEWQDRNFALKFTDIDYHVFSDAALHVVEGRSPMQRPTYRYTPLLAILLTPNHYLFFAFGKLLFVLCDLVCSWIIYEILSLRGVTEKGRLLACSLWLLNPLTATVSSRGNAEALLAVFLLGCLYFLIRGWLCASGVMYGLAVHFKIFPVIYFFPLFLLLGERERTGETRDSPAASTSWKSKDLVLLFERLLNPSRLKFICSSSITFLSLTSFFYAQYGAEFIQEAYLYHVTRRDTRHNFSVYFYMLYLIQDSWLSLPAGLLAFLPQLALLLVTSVFLHRDITFCFFVQTFAFVTFNKVCTSQYFLWYLCLLPLILPYTSMKLRQAAFMATLWFIGQGLWLTTAYYLEFEGYNTFVLMWLAGLLFFGINIYSLATIISCHEFTPTLLITANQHLKTH